MIFICSMWPMLINTAFGVARVRREWLNVAKTLEVGPLRKAFQVILPAAAPTIMTGMRISIGIAWLVIVAAEMLVGGTGIGYFVWNEWNNLSITNIICAILADRPGRHAARPALRAAGSKRASRMPSEGDRSGLELPAESSGLCKSSAPPLGGAPVGVRDHVHFDDRPEASSSASSAIRAAARSTILNILAGLDEASAGVVIMAGREVAGPEPRSRRRVPGPRADAVAHGHEEHRIRGEVALARRSRANRSTSTARTTSIWWA